jgi:hypothetical protein
VYNLWLLLYNVSINKTTGFQMQTIEVHGKTQEVLEQLNSKELIELRRQAYMRRPQDHEYNRAQRILQTQVIAVLAQKGH